MYAPNAAPIANATPGSPIGSVTLTCEASMPRLLSEKPWELVLRFSEPPTPSVITVKRIWKKFGPEPDTPLLPRKEAVSEKPGMPASPLLARGIAHEEDDRCEQREHHARAETDAEAGAHGLHGLRCGQRGDGGIGRRTGDLLGRLAWLRRCCRLRGRGWRILELLRRRGLWCHRLRCLRLSGRLCLAPPVAVWWAAGRWFAELPVRRYWAAGRQRSASAGPVPCAARKTAWCRHRIPGAAGACGAAAVVWVSGEPHEAQNLAPSMVG